MAYRKINYTPEALARRKEYQRNYARRRRSTEEGRRSAKVAWQKLDKNADPEYRKEWQRRAQLRYKLRCFGLTEDVFDLMAERGCEICGGFNNWKRLTAKLCIDHNHKTGKFRGLLCNNCNSAIGYVGEDIERLEAAIRYLRERS